MDGKPKPTAKAGRPTTLTREIAEKLETLWQLSGEDTLTDEEIAGRLNIKFGRLRGWLQRNTKYIIDVETGEKSKEGLRDIRTRAKATTKSSYLQRLYATMLKAESAGDYRTTINTLQWLLEKQFPKDFGNRLKLSGNVGRSFDPTELSNAELEELIEREFRELLKRPECRNAVLELIEQLND